MSFAALLVDLPLRLRVRFTYRKTSDLESLYKAQRGPQSKEQEFGKAGGQETGQIKSIRSVLKRPDWVSPR